MFIYDQNEIGYKLKNGNYDFKFYLSENGKVKKLLENKYSIKYNTRVQNKDFEFNKCQNLFFLVVLIILVKL